MTEQKCFIWGTEATFKGAQILDSPRAGGMYKIMMVDFDEIIFLIESFTDDEKIKLTDWLIEQREVGTKYPEITTKILESVKSRRKKAMSERIKSLISYLAKELDFGDVLAPQGLEMPYGKPPRLLKGLDMLMAYSSTSTHEAVFSCLGYCVSKKYLADMETSPPCYQMTVRGKMYAEEISKENNQKSDQKEDEQNLQCFVAMWFDESMDEVYEKAIEPAIRDMGYQPYRVDKDPHIERIDEKIIDQISKSRFIIADFTSKKGKPRGGVYYEAGFAHGFGLPVIRTCRKDRIGGVHFDTRQYQHILWEANDLRDFYDKIYLFIEGNIGNSEDAKKQGTSFVEHEREPSEQQIPIVGRRW